MEKEKSNLRVRSEPANRAFLLFSETQDLDPTWLGYPKENALALARKKRGEGVTSRLAGEEDRSTENYLSQHLEDRNRSFCCLVDGSFADI